MTALLVGVCDVITDDFIPAAIGQHELEIVAVQLPQSHCCRCIRVVACGYQDSHVLMKRQADLAAVCSSCQMISTRLVTGLMQVAKWLHIPLQ